MQAGPSRSGPGGFGAPKAQVAGLMAVLRRDASFEVGLGRIACNTFVVSPRLEIFVYFSLTLGSLKLLYLFELILILAPAQVHTSDWSMTESAFNANISTEGKEQP